MQSYKVAKLQSFGATKLLHYKVAIKKLQHCKVTEWQSNMPNYRDAYASKQQDPGIIYGIPFITSRLLFQNILKHYEKCPGKKL